MSSIPYFTLQSADLALQYDKQAGLNAATPNSTDPYQQWQFIYYPNVQAVAIRNVGTNLYLSSPSGVNYPYLTEFTFDNSYLWRVPPMFGNEGIVTMRDGSYCLTWEGGDNWKPGTKLQYWGWHGQTNQKWQISRLG